MRDSKTQVRVVQAITTEGKYKADTQGEQDFQNKTGITLIYLNQHPSACERKKAFYNKLITQY